MKTEDLVKSWPEVMKLVREKRLSTYALLMEAEFVRVEDGTLELWFGKGAGFHAKEMKKKEHKDVVEQSVGRLLGESLKVESLVGAECWRAKGEAKTRSGVGAIEGLIVVGLEDNKLEAGEALDGTRIGETEIAEKLDEDLIEIFMAVNKWAKVAVEGKARFLEKRNLEDCKIVCKARRIESGLGNLFWQLVRERYDEPCAAIGLRKGWTVVKKEERCGEER